jgi:hypothetical protein
LREVSEGMVVVVGREFERRREERFERDEVAVVGKVEEQVREFIVQCCREPTRVD